VSSQEGQLLACLISGPENLWLEKVWPGAGCIGLQGQAGMSGPLSGAEMLRHVSVKGRSIRVLGLCQKGDQQAHSRRGKGTRG